MVYNNLKTKRNQSNISSRLSHHRHHHNNFNLHDQHTCDHHRHNHHNHHNHQYLVEAEVTPVSNLPIRICTCGGKHIVLWSFGEGGICCLTLWKYDEKRWEIHLNTKLWDESFSSSLLASLSSHHHWHHHCRHHHEWSLSSLQLNLINTWSLEGDAGRGEEDDSLLKSKDSSSLSKQWLSFLHFSWKISFILTIIFIDISPL